VFLRTSYQQALIESESLDRRRRLRLRNRASDRIGNRRKRLELTSFSGSLRATVASLARLSWTCRSSWTRFTDPSHGSSPDWLGAIRAFWGTSEKSARHVKIRARAQT
jgi:hypothetical protein